MSVRYLDLADYLAIAAEVTDQGEMTTWLRKYLTQPESG